MKDRIVELRRVPAGEIDGAPWNWRQHPAGQQAAVKASLEELGMIDALRVRQKPDGRYELWDGHLRRDLFAGVGPDTLVPVLVTDLSEAEAKKANVIFDPLAALAEANAAKLDELLREVQTGSEELAKVMDELAKENGILSVAEAAAEGGLIPERFVVMIECESEAQQVALIEQLQGEGYECRALTL